MTVIKEVDEKTAKPKDRPDHAYSIDDMKDFIKVNVPGPKDSKAVIKHLWGMCFRVNYYKYERIKENLFPRQTIDESKFISLGIHDDGIIVKEIYV